jgi:hypothetical protein
MYCTVRTDADDALEELALVIVKLPYCRLLS